MNAFIIPGEIPKPGCHTEHHKIHQTDQYQYLGDLPQKRLLYIFNKNVQNSTGVGGGGVEWQGWRCPEEWTKSS